ncbi:hypothetical protein D9M72_523390 [compost metagenome]
MSADGGGEAADFRNGLCGAVEQFAPVFDCVPGSVGAARLLVGEKRKDQVPLGLAPGPGKVPHDSEDHGVHVLHVHGSAAPDQAVLEFGSEGID